MDLYALWIWNIWNQLPDIAWYIGLQFDLFEDSTLEPQV